MTSRYPLGAPVMLQLGAYQFGLNTAAFQGLQRSDDYRWPEQERLGREAALQFVGKRPAIYTVQRLHTPKQVPT